jgi:two-component system KDP operon response regulator KdpE
MPPIKEEILVIGDEAQMRRLLSVTLESAGYSVTLAENAAEGIRNAETHRYEAIVLDLGLPDSDGIDVLKKIRQWAVYPIIILSVRSSENGIIEALDAGANDYLTKPFRSGELLARIRSALRLYTTSPGGSKFFFSGIEVDLEMRVVRKRGEVVKLTPTEFSLLSLFIHNAGKVLTHNYILQQVWGPKFEGESQYTRVYVGQLRKKLEENPNNPSFFVTESGIGYRFTLENEK